MGGGTRLRRVGRLHFQPLRPARGNGRRSRAGAYRIAYRQPADRRQVRRRLRSPRRNRGAPGTRRGRDRDRAAGRGRRLAQRGGFALRARNDGIGGLRRPPPPRRDRGGRRSRRYQRRRRPAQGPRRDARRETPRDRLSRRRFRGGAYRAGPGARTRRASHRRRDRHSGRAPHARPGDRRGGPCRHHAALGAARRALGGCPDGRCAPGEESMSTTSTASPSA